LLNSPERSESLQGVGRAKRRSRERGRSNEGANAIHQEQQSKGNKIYLNNLL